MPASAVRGLFDKGERPTLASRFQEWAKVLYITVAVVALGAAATFVGGIDNRGAIQDKHGDRFR